MHTTSHIGSVSAEFLPMFPSQIWVSDVTFVTFFSDKKCDALHLSHFWEECDALAHENIFCNLWRFLSHPSRKTSHLGPAGTKLFWTWRNVMIGLGLKHVFLLPSLICHLSRKHEAGRPFGLRPTHMHMYIYVHIYICICVYMYIHIYTCIRVMWYAQMSHVTNGPCHTSERVM